MKEATLILPHQLYKNHPSLQEGRSVVMIEDNLFFKEFAFHAQKLIYHRATMKSYQSYLESIGHHVAYVSSTDAHSSTERWMSWLSEQGVVDLFMTDPVDYLMMRRIQRFSSRMNIRLHVLESPNFGITSQNISKYFQGKKRFFLTAFYIDERKRLKILLDESGDPIGGQWTFDSDNRKKLPKGIPIPKLPQSKDSLWVSEAIDYVTRFFENAPGERCKPIYPITHDEALAWLRQFCVERLMRFGDFQDAIQKDERYLFHGVLTPMLNIGLINPGDILEAVIEAGRTHAIPLNNVEGFVRQVMGWREYIRAVYQLRGVEERKRHFWNHHRPMPASFWTGNTGIPPLDDMIKGVNETAYAHHIERLMIAGNFMLLCEIDADEVYTWFMSLFIDAYDWVMVPNVYGMSQFADGGLMSTKPYISGSNYILKMSNYQTGPWCAIWDALFWRFINKHRDFFLKNPRLAMMVRTFDKMPITKQGDHMRVAEEYLERLHRTA